MGNWRISLLCGLPNLTPYKGILKPKGLVTWPPAYGLTPHCSQRDLPKNKLDHGTALLKPSMAPQWRKVQVQIPDHDLA